MSRYLDHLAEAIALALGRVPSAQPPQVAGYWANRQFWLDEFQHLLDAIEDYPNRLERMKNAERRLLPGQGGHQYRDQFGNPMQGVRDTTDPSSRRSAASQARTALKALADRALDLQIASYEEYDEFLASLRITEKP